MGENEKLAHEHKLGAFTVKVAGQAYTISTIALLLMLAGILIPTAKYAFDLREPTPAQLLVAVSMAMFSAVLFLWILDSTSLLPFRSPWVARSVYAAAITSILGTSVGVYRDAFNESKYPYDGLWEITVWQTSKPVPVAQRQLLMAFSKSAESYWGFSDAESPASPSTAGDIPHARWLTVTEFSPEQKQIAIEIQIDSQVIYLRADNLEIRPHAKYVAGQTKDSITVSGYQFTMKRPK